MRILQVIPSYLPATRYGGPIFSTHALSKALVKRGHEVQVYTTYGGQNPNSFPAATVELDGVIETLGRFFRMLQQQIRHAFFVPQ